MPLYKTIVIENNTTLYFWKITETTSSLLEEAQLNENSKLRLEKIKFKSHKKGFLATKLLLQSIGYTDFDLFYDTNGKPFLIDKNHISISHSHDFSAVAISDKKIGLDIEQLKEKTLRNASRFMTIAHLDNLNEKEKIMKATIIWGIKEAVFKLKNEIGIRFFDDIYEKPFSINDKKTIAKLNFNNKTEEFSVIFDLIEDYAYVFVFEQ